MFHSPFLLSIWEDYTLSLPCSLAEMQLDLANMFLKQKTYLPDARPSSPLPNLHLLLMQR